MTLLAVAVRNLRRHRRRSGAALAAMVLGVAAMVTARGFINAQHRMMREDTVEGQLGAIQVHRRGYLSAVQRSPLQLAFEDTAGLRERLRAVEGVTAVAPRIVFGAMLAPPEQSPAAQAAAYLTVTAVDPGAEPAVTPLRTQHLAGRALGGRDVPELLLEADVAEAMGAAIDRPGAPLPTVEQWPALLANDCDGAPNGEAVRLVGTFKAEMPGDRKVALLPLGTAQRLLRMERQVTEYAIAVRELAEAPEVRARIAEALGKEFEAHTWDEVAPLLKELHGYQDAAFNLLSALFLFVVLLGIVNAMLMSVLERVREIGTMLALGMRRAEVARLFLLEGAVLGALGGAAGAAIGQVVVLVLDALELRLPLAGTTTDSVLHFGVSAGYLFSVALAACASSALAALWPALRAARLRPVEALRHV